MFMEKRPTKFFLGKPRHLGIFLLTSEPGFRATDVSVTVVRLGMK